MNGPFFIKTLHDLMLKCTKIYPKKKKISGRPPLKFEATRFSTAQERIQNQDAFLLFCVVFYDIPVESLLMVPLCEMARKVVLIRAFVATDVALERLLVAVTTHVDGVEDVVCEVHLAVRAGVERLRGVSGALNRGGGGGHGGPGLAVAVRAVGVAVWRGGGGRLSRACGRQSGDGRDKYGLFVSTGLRIVLLLRGQVGQLAGQRGELVQRVVHD